MTAEHETVAWRVERRGADDAVVADMVSTYLDELRATVPGLDPELAAPTRPQDFVWPNGTFLLLIAGEEPVACGAIRRLDPGIGEVRRMWVRPPWRGRGAGRALLDALEHLAREMELAELRLDTRRELVRAIDLYRQNGFVEIEPYNDNAFADFWMAKRLGR